MSREEEVLNQLKVIIDPDLGKDIVSLGFIKELTITKKGEVSFDVELTTPACPVKEQFKSSCEAEVGKLDWVKKVNVKMTAQKGQSALAPSAPGLARVKNIIAISSCKGGVGKSTVAVNFAHTLARSGAKVGIFDADIYGPSLPTMIKPDSLEIRQNNEMLIPFEADNVALMSFGYLNQGPGAGPAIMRGPMVTQIISQLLTGTQWGELDYLVIDFPPGTGDIQLTLTQVIPLTAAIIVTTPQELSFVDVVKGIQMFDKLKVPTVAVVENMSYFSCPDCSSKHYLFGQGARKKLVDQFGIKNSYELPINPSFSHSGDSGKPIVLSEGDDDIKEVFQALVDSAVREISKIRYGGENKTSLSFDKDRGMVVTLPSGEEHTMTAADLRRRCRCAHCIEEFTGKKLLDPSTIPDDIYPIAMRPMGNYAVAIEWSDGHNSSIYPYESIIPETFAL